MVDDKSDEHFEKIGNKKVQFEGLEFEEIENHTEKDEFYVNIENLVEDDRYDEIVGKINENESVVKKIQAKNKNFPVVNHQNYGKYNETIDKHDIHQEKKLKYEKNEEVYENQDKYYTKDEDYNKKDYEINVNHENREENIDNIDENVYHKKIKNKDVYVVQNLHVKNTQKQEVDIC